MRILVVDDEPIVLNCCQRILEDQGHTVRLVGGANEAIAAMEAEPAEILLVDIKMPTRDGIDLIREIKERWPKVSVIVMTGYSTPETIRKSRSVRADEFIDKPFTPEELLEKLRAIISKGGSR
jgi:DNA-binding NtrC family response regulator